MRRKWLVAGLGTLFVLTVALSLYASGPAPAKSAETKAAPKGSCSDQVKVDPAAFVNPQPEVLCLVNICKMDQGTLYRCTAHVCQGCCRYDTNLDCVADPNCTDTIPPFCNTGQNCPPNACKRTCGGNSCGNVICH